MGGLLGDRGYALTTPSLFFPLPWEHFSTPGSFPHTSAPQFPQFAVMCSLVVTHREPVGAVQCLAAVNAGKCCMKGHFPAFATAVRGAVASSDQFPGGCAPPPPPGTHLGQQQREGNGHAPPHSPLPSLCSCCCAQYRFLLSL